MTDRQEEQVRRMKAGGCGYVKIARELGLSENTVKSFCRRKGLNGAADTADGDKRNCLCCGTQVMQNPGRKVKKFCSDKCRNAWWNSHQDRVERRAHYGNAGRKYCCHACYVADRFGGGADE